jgi:hypothetical protein
MIYQLAAFLAQVLWVPFENRAISTGNFGAIYYCQQPLAAFRSL